MLVFGGRGCTWPHLHLAMVQASDGEAKVAAFGTHSPRFPKICAKNCVTGMV